MRKYRHLMLITAFFVTVSLAVTSCSSVNEQTPVSNGEVEKKEEPKQEQKEMVLRVARDWEKTDMDPATWGTHADIAFGPNVFETLLAYDKDLNATGKLAEKWDVSDDNLTYTFYLRKGVQFHHNYGEMKASDVVFSIERMRDPEVRATSNGPALGIDNMKEVVAEDDYILKITLAKEDPIFLYKLCEAYLYVISQKASEEMGIEGFAKKPIGTGPFVFDKGTPGERTEVVKNENYWGEKAKLDRIVFNIISEPATMFNAFESGEIDFMGINEASKIIEYKNNPKYKVEGVPTRYDGAIGSNVQIKPFDDIRVRQAISHAINREEINEDYYLGLEVAPTSIFPTGAKYIVKGNVKSDYNPEKAKKLLAEAGYPDGFSTEIYCPNDQTSIGPATLLQSYLTQVGIKADLKAVDFGVFLSTVREGNAPLWYMINGPEIIPDSWFERWTSSFYPGSNWCGLQDAEYDSYVKQAMDATTEEDKAVYYEKAQERFAKLLPLYPINTSGAFYMLQSKVKGFEVKPNLIFTYEKLYIEE